MVYVLDIKPSDPLLVEVFAILWVRRDVRFAKFFFMLMAFIVRVVSIGYERNQG